MRVKKFTLQDTKDLFIHRHKSVQDHDPVKLSDYFHSSRWNVFTFHKSCFISWRNWLWVITGYCLFLYHDTDYRWPLFFLMLVIKKIICEVSKPKTLHLKRGDVSRPFFSWVEEKCVLLVSDCHTLPATQNQKRRRTKQAESEFHHSWLWFVIFQNMSELKLGGMKK